MTGPAVPSARPVAGSGWWWLLRARLRELFGLPVPPPPETDEAAEPVPPAPRVELALARAVPGALVRLLPGLLVVAGGALVGAGSTVWTVTAVFAVVVTWRPVWPVSALFTLALGVWVLGGDDLLLLDPRTGTVPGIWRLAALVLTVHLVARLAALAAHVGWRSTVEVPVLGRLARSVLTVQVVAQSLVLLVAWVRTGLGGAGGQEWLRIVAVAGAALLALLLVPREWMQRRQRDRRY